MSFQRSKCVICYQGQSILNGISPETNDQMFPADRSLILLVLTVDILEETKLSRKELRTTTPSYVSSELGKVGRFSRHTANTITEQAGLSSHLVKSSDVPECRVVALFPDSPLLLRCGIQPISISDILKEGTVTQTFERIHSFT